MAGTTQGGKKAAKVNLTKDPDFYSRIGKIGGKNGHTGGFHDNPELARRAGAIGGKKSRRKKASTIKDPLLGKTFTVDEKHMQSTYEQAAKPETTQKDPTVLERLFSWVKG